MDPRIERTRATVMDTATQLLVEGGPTALTMDAVVARSGVAKSTLYRHWPTRDALVAAVFTHIAPEIPVPDPDLPFDAALRTFVQAIAAIAGDEHWKPLIPALLLLKAQHPDIAELEAHLNDQQMDIIGPVIERGIAEGHLRDDLPVDVLVALLVGPVVANALTSITPLTPEFTDEAVDHFLRGAAPI